MRFTNPFALGYFVTTVLVSISVGILVGLGMFRFWAASKSIWSADALSAIGSMCLFISPVLLVDALVALGVSQAFPGHRAAGWKLWPVATVANPVTMIVLPYYVFHWGCVNSNGRGCPDLPMIVLALMIVVLPTCGGALWNWLAITIGTRSQAPE